MLATRGPPSRVIRAAPRPATVHNRNDTWGGASGHLPIACRARPAVACIGGCPIRRPLGHVRAIPGGSARLQFRISEAREAEPKSLARSAWARSRFLARPQTFDGARLRNREVTILIVLDKIDKQVEARNMEGMRYAASTPSAPRHLHSAHGRSAPCSGG